jgi:quinol monooxygenase YgiN
VLRVLHEFAIPDPGAETSDTAADITAETARMRSEPGCVTAELYRMLEPAHVPDHALTSVWASEPDYWRFWEKVLKGSYPALNALLTDDEAATEFYARSAFKLIDGVWGPEDLVGERRIFWPARGPVRIIIETAVEATDAMYAKIAAEMAETRREDGCQTYGWYENVELKGHLLLLEVWADQVQYDRHWHLRLASAAFVGDNLRRPATPQRGLVSREFYRQQQFRHHYDRWLPSDPMAAATTIEFPAT